MTALAKREDAGEQLATWKRVSEVCKQIVVACSCRIDGKNYVKVEGWQSLAAMGQLTPEIESMEYVEMVDPWKGGTLKGMRAKAILKRDSDGYVLSTAYGFCDYNEVLTRRDGKTVQRWKDQYAVESMAQTRAISKVCRNKLAFVVTMMNAGLQTTPAEEVPPGGFNQAPAKEEEPSHETLVTQGALGKRWAKNGVFFIDIGGQLCWTRSEGLTAEIESLGNQVVSATVKQGQKPGSYQVIAVDPIKEEPANDLTQEPDDIPF